MYNQVNSPWWLWSVGGSQKVPAPLTACHFSAAEVQLSHIVPFPWLLSGQPTSPISKPPGGTSPFPAQGADSPEGKRGAGEQE